MNKIRFAVIGCGAIGSKHLEYLKNIENVEIVAVCDSNNNSLEMVKIDNVKKYTHYHKLLKNEKIDIINICTPHYTHFEIAYYALKNHNVILEKPMALCYEDCQRLINQSKKHDTNLWVVKQNRYNSAIKKAIELLEKQEIGSLKMFNCSIFWNRNESYYTNSNWRGKIKKEKGVLYTIGSHFIDILIWILGDVETIKTAYFENNDKKYIEIEDYGSSVIKFKNGVVGSIQWTTSVAEQNYEGSIVLFGDKGTIKIGGKYLNELTYLNDTYCFSDEKPNQYTSYQGTSSNHKILFESIIQCFISNQKDSQLVDGTEASKSILVIDQIYSKFYGGNKNTVV